MFFFIIQQIIIWTVVIYISHSIYNYIKDLYSTPKINDLVHQPQKEYQKMFETIYNNTTHSKDEQTPVKDMKYELRDYLKRLKQQPQPINA